MRAAESRRNHELAEEQPRDSELAGMSADGKGVDTDCDRKGKKWLV